MKKILYILVILLFSFSSAQTLKAGIVEEYIPDGFFDSWGVISKLQNSNNLELFNYESKDIWTLSGYNNILILENLESGAYSKIEISEKNQDGKTLKFSRSKTVQEKTGKIIYKETVEFILSGNNFSGKDNFIIEHYNQKNTLVKKDWANYKVSGVKISGN